MRRPALLCAILLLTLAPLLLAKDATVWSKQEKPIYDTVKTLRSLDDSTRAKTTQQLALRIRELPTTVNKVKLATALASLSTEGDVGHATLQDVATTLSDSLHEQPELPAKGQPAYPYIALAQLERYEHVQVALQDPQYTAASDKLKADDDRRQRADFTLNDLDGKSWKLSDLKGKVVLVNFWATWCPPCNRELPDLEALYNQYEHEGLVVLAISDEEGARVQPFIKKQKLTYPILLDPGRKVNDLYEVEGIPKTFIYDRDGKIVAQAIDMRTRHQFEELLAQAGLK